MQDDQVIVNMNKVVCDGGDGAAGHPRVYLDLSKRNEIHCPYCGRHFVKKES